VIFIDLSFYHVGKEKKRTELVFVATNQVVVTRELNSVEFFLFLLQFSRKKRKKRIIFKKEAKKRSFHRKGGKRGGVGCQISMNSFLSVPEDEQVAIAFSGDGITTELDEIPVIYEMLINTNIRSTPYAKRKSIIKDEGDILFSNKINILHWRS
jgi:hypothetical protein